MTLQMRKKAFRSIQQAKKTVEKDSRGKKYPRKGRMPRNLCSLAFIMKKFFKQVTVCCVLCL